MMQKQAELERRMATLGIDQFRKQAQEAKAAQQATRSRSVKTVLDVLIEPTAKAISEFLGRAGTGRAGRRHHAARLIQDQSPEALAFIAGTLILDGIAQMQSLTRLAVRIGAAVVAVWTSWFPGSW
ncbi:hypothetical protein [Afifella pfennigii]|uniref:hypothetical protein n=1 Tax=Afifella pfennigii TaxID=209897 RepID=UPI00055762B6|nr:hypothetical protein [Afifella pfennigii]